MHRSHLKNNIFKIRSLQFFTDQKANTCNKHYIQTLLLGGGEGRGDREWRGVGDEGGVRQGSRKWGERQEAWSSQGDSKLYRILQSKKCEDTKKGYRFWQYEYQK